MSSEQFVELRRRAADVVAEKAGSDDAAEQLQCRQLVDVERRFLERVDELRQVVLGEEHTHDASASPTECSVTGEELTAYLRRRFPESPDLRVTHLEAVPGGRSKETLLVSLAGTTELPAEVIVRKDRPVGLLETRAADEFAILRAVHAHGGVPVAQPYFADDTQNLSGDDSRGTLLVMAAGKGRQGRRVLPRPGRAAARVPTGHREPAGRRAGPPARGPTRHAGRDRPRRAGVGQRGVAQGRHQRHGRPHRRPDGPAHRRRPAGAPVAARPHRRRRSLRPAVSPPGRLRTAQHPRREGPRHRAGGLGGGHHRPTGARVGSGLARRHGV